MATGFRSPNWIAATLISVPASSQANPTTAQPINYVFDATMRIEHHRETQKTSHPVQTGAAISDHAYAKPSRVVLDIGMSDLMQSYIPGQWPTEGDGKSLSAYQTLVNLQLARTLLVLTTRLYSYPSMLITGIQASDTNETWQGLRAVVTFEELPLAQVGVAGGSSTGPAVPARPQTTGSTGIGFLQTISPSASLTKLHQVPATQQAAIGSVPGDGSWSSNIIQ